MAVEVPQNEEIFGVREYRGRKGVGSFPFQRVNKRTIDV